jgi:hypothetical protein
VHREAGWRIVRR